MKKRKLGVSTGVMSESRSVGEKTIIQTKRSFAVVLLWISPRRDGAAHRENTQGWERSLVLESYVSESNVKGA